ncbi:MAG: protein kinase [Syntrophomonas sp.]
MKNTVLGDRYELLEKIGEGGMASLYKARCRTLDRIVAVKILKPEFLNDRSFVEKFNTEALAAGQLSHPNIVNIYDVGQQDDIYYIVMEYVEGKTLKEIIDEEAPLPVEKAVDIAIMICDGIQHAHSKGIIHRDIKPHNILVTREGMVKVADFGIAQAISKKTITFGGNIVGSVHYISPEQAKGEPVRPATDIYSLGCVLYEMLTGKMPFDADSPITVALKHIHDQPVSPRAVNSSIPPALEGIVLKAMEKNPQNRFAYAEDMRNALLDLHSNKFSSYSRKHISEKTMIMSPLNGEEDEYMGRKRRIRPTAVIVAIISLLGLLGGFLFVAGGSFFPDEVVVPGVEGMNIKEAREELSKVNLTMTVLAKENNDEFDNDTIISQEPAKGQKVKEGREIKVILSLGSESIKVPSVVGLNLSDAKLKLSNAGFALGDIDREFDDKYSEDSVISQEPKSGSMEKKGTSISLMVSKGKTPEKIAMPDLLGLTLDEATRRLQENKLVLDHTSEQDSSQYYAGQVMVQSVQAGVMVDEQSKINLTVSKGGPGPVARSKDIQLQLPIDQEYYKVMIKIKDSRGEREVYNQLHRAGELVSLAVSYYGNGTAEVYLNSKLNKTIKL